MTKLTLCLVACLFASSCMNSPRPIDSNSPAGTNSSSANSKPTNEKTQTAIAHTTENQPPPAYSNSNTGGGGKWSASGDPIDTKAFDTAIMAAEKKLAGKTGDKEAHRDLGAAFYKRAVALTEARQYASAIGDYRRALKHDPDNAEAKEWIDKITMIYGSMNKQAPREGEEPAPLPFPAAK